ncbi:hypothetical protein FNV43_RR17758 [Rhamnella rubrinervis]|uniref:S-protein homolog n=1 Tax=Rhamnella rubrinervis TaxID=2594499 RepID=A0A8K0GXX9_9ROSA|nr:hypothetical protein FNV43_RR17758 [Rhamnella rubrinervis]
MKGVNNITVLLLLLVHFGTMSNIIDARVHVYVKNSLGDGQCMRLHCQSKDDDLGTVVLEDDQEARWSFSVNFFGTTLFYCHVNWNTSASWYSFDAYSAERDHRRCNSECHWLISNGGSLLGYDQECSKWEMFPLRTL